LSSSNDEKDLIDAAKTDPKAFGSLYRRYVERIFNYIYYRIGNARDAEDLTGSQEIFSVSAPYQTHLITHPGEK